MASREVILPIWGMELPIEEGRVQHRRSRLLDHMGAHRMPPMENGGEREPRTVHRDYDCSSEHA